jgi:hypothetical protein
LKLAEIQKNREKERREKEKEMNILKTNSDKIINF